MGQLDGKIVVVTGATSGIGERIAELFVAEGASVVAAGRRTEEGRALEARCDGRLSFIRTDVSVEADVRAMIEHAVSRFGRLDCLVNNAGSGAPMVSITEATAEQFDSIFAVNVRGVFFGIKHAAAVMLRQGGGSVVTIASAAGLHGGLAGHIYSGSKAAASQLTRSAAAELSHAGIRLNCISPGAIVTGIFAKNAGVGAAPMLTGCWALSGTVSPRCSPFPEPARLMILPVQRCFWQATRRRSSPARTLPLTAV